MILIRQVQAGPSSPASCSPQSGSFSEVGRHALVTWDGSREAARAIRDAMQLLQAAKRVTVLALDPRRQGHMHGGAHLPELVAHLGRHGVVADATEITSETHRVTNTLLEHASRLGADLLVMGA